MHCKKTWLLCILHYTMHIGYIHYRVGTKTISHAPRIVKVMFRWPNGPNNWICYGEMLTPLWIFKLSKFFRDFKLIWPIWKSWKAQKLQVWSDIFNQKWIHLNILWMNIAPWTNIVEFGQKNDLQDLGFGTYYNHCARWAMYARARPI